jgi:hypothetical protein
MPYSIQTIIYGIPLTHKIYQFITDDTNEDEEWSVEPEDHGFEVLYSGSHDAPGYCGVVLAEYDECTDYRPLSEFMVKPTTKQKAASKKLIAALDPLIRKMAPKIGLYVIYHSS